jgi:nitroimidazol reductase NimA-like FMN-containing flavoprotein (pyridoxamine 5'-phosphate oxidase superfamily)
MAELRTQSKFIDKARIEELLKSKKDGVLCFTDGQSPYGVPLAYTSYHNDTIYFGLNPSGRKFDYFKKCANVCFTVYHTFKSSADPQKTGWWSIILDGGLLQVTDPEEIKAIADMMDKQGVFPPGLKEKFLGVILKNPANSNFFKMKITRFGGKELGEYRPEEEVQSAEQNE